MDAPSRSSTAAVEGNGGGGTGYTFDVRVLNHPDHQGVLVELLISPYCRSWCRRYRSVPIVELRYSGRCGAGAAARYRIRRK